MLSTLHTSSAAGSVTRLLDMGLEDYLLASTLNGIAAQRLLRTLCTHCREPNPALADISEQLGLERFRREPIRLYRPVGCSRCNGTGYYGRTGIAEMLVMSDDIRKLILHREDGGDPRAAVAAGMRTLYEDGMRAGGPRRYLPRGSPAGNARDLTMPLYRFKAVTGPGDVVEGEMEAISQVAVLDHLRGQGYMPIRADEIRRPLAWRYLSWRCAAGIASRARI